MASLLRALVAIVALQSASAYLSGGLSAPMGSSRARAHWEPVMACKAQGGEGGGRGLGRRALLAGISGAALAPGIDVWAAEQGPQGLEALAAARKALDPIDGYIKKAEWDKCRTTLNNPPLGFAGPNSIKGQMEKVGGGKGAFKGIAQDVITNQRLLDSFCYSNVFVDEGRQVLGLKIDYATPKMYLKSVKESLDQFIEMAGE